MRREGLYNRLKEKESEVQILIDNVSSLASFLKTTVERVEKIEKLLDKLSLLVLNNCEKIDKIEKLVMSLYTVRLLEKSVEEEKKVE